MLSNISQEYCSRVKLLKVSIKTATVLMTALYLKPLNIEENAKFPLPKNKQCMRRNYLIPNQFQIMKSICTQEVNIGLETIFNSSN
jgi:hypothetical protein